MKRVLIAIAGVLCLLVGIVFASVIWLRSDGGRSWIAKEIATLASTPGETEVAIGAITGDPFGSFGLSDIRVADKKGVWLTVKSADISWRPLDLFGGRVTVSRAAVNSVAVDRLPESAPSTEETSLADQIDSLRDMPLVRIESVTIEPLILGEAVLGQAARLKITGGVAASAAQSSSGNLEITRLDGVPGDIKVDAAYDIAKNSLAVDINAREPAGGLVARALEVPGFPALIARLRGDGPLRDWKGRLDIAFDSVASGQADLAIRYGDDTAFEVTGSARLPADGTDLLGKLAAGEHQFHIAGTYSSKDLLTLSAVRLTARDAEISASGRLDLNDLAVDAKASLKKHGDAPLVLAPSDISLATVTADVAVSGKLPLPVLKLTFDVGRFAQPDVATADIAGAVTMEPDSMDKGRLTGTVTVNALTWTDRPELSDLSGEAISVALASWVDLASSSISVKNLGITARNAALKGQGEFNWQDGDGTMKTTLSVPDLSVLRQFAGTPLSGTLAMSVDAAIRAFGTDASATVGGKAQAFSTGDAIADAVLAREADFGTALTLTGDKFEAKAVEFTSGRAKLTGEASVDLASEAIAGKYHAAIAAGEPVRLAESVNLTCACDLDGSISGKISAIDMTGDIVLRSVAAQNAEFADIKIGYGFANLPDRPGGTITLKTQSPVGDLTARTKLALRDERLRLDDLRAESRDATVEGALDVPLSGLPISGDLKFDIRDLKGLLATARLDGDGTIAGTATLRGDAGRQNADATATVAKLRFRSAPNAPAIVVERATVTLAAKDLLAGKRNNLKLDLEDGAVGDLSVNKLIATAAGALDDLQLTMQAAGDWRGPLSVDTKAAYAVKNGKQSVSISTLRGTAVGKKFELGKSMRLTRDATDYSVEPVDFSYGESNLNGHVRSGTAGLDVSLKLAGLQLASIDPFWPLGINGEAAASLDVKGAWPNPPGTFSISAPSLKVDQAPDTPALAVNIGGDWQKGRLAIKGSLKAGNAAPSVFNASLPLRLEGPNLFVSVPREQPVSGQFDWSGEMAALWRFSPLTEHVLRGNGKIDLTLAGTVTKPDVRGALALTDGYYESLEYGTVLKPINLTVLFDGQRARITRLDAGDGSGGKVDGKGAVTFDAEAGFPFDLALNLNALTAVRRDDVQASASGAFSVRGSTKEAKVESKLTTDRVEVRILDRLPPNVVTLDVVEIGRSGVVETKEKDPNPLADNIELAIDVEMPRRVFVRGRGIESEWKGNLKVAGRASAPRVTGYVALVRGQLTVVGKTFQMESGTVVLPESAYEEPNLSLVATYTGRNLTVRADVDGPISKPTIKLSSVPALPQDEIVSQILFDKNSSKLSALEAAQLALAVAELAGKGGGGIMDFARKTLGVDVLKFESVETANGAQSVVGAGKYITDDVYVGVKQGVTPDSTSVGVEVEVTPNIFLESDVRRSGESDVGVKFKYDY